jgi:putative transposase
MNIAALSISHESIRQIALTVDRYQVMRARFGRRAADTKRKPRGVGVTTTRALQRVEVDHFLCDVHLVCEKTGVRLGRPWLTLVVDHYSGMVLGNHLSFAPPSASSVLAALRHAILPKEMPQHPDVDAAVTSDLPMNWPAFGVPDLMVVDNGLDLTSAGVREACIALGIDLLFAPPRTPWYKGVVERFGRTMNTRFVHWLPGTTLGKATSDLGYDGAENAVLTFTAFNSLLERYIVTIHNKTPRRTDAKPPETLFLESCQLWPVRVPTSMAEFDAAVSLEFTRTLRQTGLEFMGLQYQSDELGSLWNRSPSGVRLSFKVNPLDLKTIQVRNPVTGEYFVVACVDDYEWPRTLPFHKAVHEYAKKLRVSTTDRAGLARAEREFMQLIETTAKSSGRALRRMQAEVLRQGSAELPVDETSVAAPIPAEDVVGDAFDEAFCDE